MDRSKVLVTTLLLVLAAGCRDGGNGQIVGRFAGSVSGFRVAQAEFTGPITGGLRGHALWDSWYNLADLGYIEEEYFVSGRAKVQPDGAEADYTTRIIVRHPQHAADFNGTVLLDWVNVTAQFENAVDTLEAHSFLVRHGYAFVHVSAQSAGICCIPLTPKTWDPVRYEPLNHPGDEYSFDMFAQIAKAIRSPKGVDPMGGLRVQHVLAAGQSQSAIRLHDYVNLGYARSRVIDGILIHSDPDAGKSFAESPPVPVIQLLSDYEALPEEPGHNGPNYRLWEIAGAAHQDFWVGYHQEIGASARTLVDAPQQPGSADEDLHLTAGNYGEQIHPLLATCVLAGAAFPMRYAVDAALFHLNRWAAGGSRPPSGPRYEFSGGMLARDTYGNAKGGIRYPPIEVPVASYVSTVCQLGGITVPFTELQLQLLYPTHADYFCKIKAASEKSVKDGYLLPEDAEDLMTRVDAASNRWLSAGVKDCL